MNLESGSINVIANGTTGPIQITMNNYYKVVPVMANDRSGAITVMMNNNNNVISMGGSGPIILYPHIILYEYYCAYMRWHNLDQQS